METKEDKVPLGQLDLEAHWDPRDLRDSRDHLDCLEEREVLVIQVVTAHLEYLVDMLVSISPSKLTVNQLNYYFIYCCKLGDITIHHWSLLASVVAH